MRRCPRQLTGFAVAWRDKGRENQAHFSTTPPPGKNEALEEERFPTARPKKGYPMLVEDWIRAGDSREISGQKMMGISAKIIRRTVKKQKCETPWNQQCDSLLAKSNQKTNTHANESDKLGQAE